MPELPVQTRHNLPAQVTPFIGRARELEQLGLWLQDNSTRLITIAGIGGMGKTRLAQEAAWQHISHFEDGVFFVPLAGSDDLLNPIANGIGLRLIAIDSPFQELKNYLSKESMLLVLDNFEHLIQQGTLIVDLLSAAPYCKIVVTSRQRLNLRGETLLNLAGMEVKSWHSLSQASDADVTQLFRYSARRGRSDFELTDRNYKPVAEICALVEGMPLGVELAASWLNALTPEEIAGGIRDSVDFLKTEFQDMPERHRRMRTVLEQSLHLLPEAEQRVFVQLCVFSAGFTLEAAQAVTGADLNALSTLVNKSLLQRDLQGRYTIHELLRQFGQEILDPEIFTRHARFYCKLLADLEGELIAGDVKMACHQIEPEFANIRSAWKWASTHEMYDELSSSCLALDAFVVYRNRYVEWGQLQDTVANSLREAAESSKRDIVLAQMLNQQSWIALRFGHLEQGLQSAQESLELFTRHRFTPVHPWDRDPYQPMTILHTLLGHMDTARQMGQERLRFYGERDDLIGVGASCFTLTVVELAAGDYAAVRQYGNQGNEAFRSINCAYVTRAYLLMNWANAERASGNIDEARRLFRASYDHMCAVGAIVGQATALTHLAQLAFVQGEYAEARQTLEGNIEVFRQIGDSGGLAVTLEGLAQIAIAQKQPRQAARLLVEALEITGIRLPGYTLSLLLCACKLPLKPELRTQIAATIHSHPAANDEIKQKAASVKAPWAAPLPLEQLVAEMRRGLLAFAAQANQPDALTERELHILRLLAQGLSNQEIADHLVMTVGTIKWYLNHIYAKLRVKNRTEAVNVARKLDLLP